MINNALEKLENKLHYGGIRYETQVDLSSFSYFKSGGVVQLIVFPCSHTELEASVKILYETGVPYKVVGETSNLIFLDERDYTCLLSVSRVTSIAFDEERKLLVSDCGAMLPDLSREALYLSLTGYEGLEGIPGSVGGAVYMNAGAYGYEIKNVLSSVEVIQQDGGVKTYAVEELGFHYRNSIFKASDNTDIISRCYFKCKKGDQSEIYKVMELLHAKRHKYQEFMYPNLGSLFSGSIYRALGETDRIYKLVSMAYYLWCYKWKLFRRESPINRKWINDFTVKRFGFTFREQPFSEKTMNSLVNNGHHTDEILDYISQIKSKIGDRVPIENEIVEPF